MAAHALKSQAERMHVRRTRAWSVFTALTIASGGAMLWLAFTGTLRGEVTSLLPSAIGFGGPRGGGTALSRREFHAPEPDRPHVVDLEGGTDVCLTVTCPCSDRTHHADGYTFGKFQCPDCGRAFKLPQAIRVLDAETS